MREIKFRAWDKDNGEWFTKWTDPRVGDCIDDGSYIFSLTDKGNKFIIEQFTNLCDKNGRDIYEGDILITGSHTIAVVRWNDAFASFCLRSFLWAFDHFFTEAVEPIDCEIIGNIHENPELLK